MKLLTVCMTLDEISGAGPTARTVQLSRALTDMGVSCAIATCRARSEADATAALQGIEMVMLPSVAGRFRVPVGNFSALEETVRSADLVLLMNHWTTLNAVAYRAAIRQQKPYVVCPCGALPIFGRSQTLKAVYNRAVGRRMVAGADGHIAITRDEVRHLAAYGVAPERVVVIPNGVPPSAGTPLPESFRRAHRLDKAPFALFLGRLSVIKGPDLLVSAFAKASARFPGWRLVMAGPDEGMETGLRRLVVQAGIEGKVHFVGYLGSAAKRDALAAANLLVVPSRSEAMSIVVLEAAGAGRPVLVTDRCGLPDVSEAGGGWIVPASVEGLTRGLSEAFADPVLQLRGERWREFALRRFSWSRVASQHVEMFSRVITAKGRQ